MILNSSRRFDKLQAVSVLYFIFTANSGTNDGTSVERNKLHSGSVERVDQTAEIRGNDSLMWQHGRSRHGKE